MDRVRVKSDPNSQFHDRVVRALMHHFERAGIRSIGEPVYGTKRPDFALIDEYGNHVALVEVKTLESEGLGFAFSEDIGECIKSACKNFKSASGIPMLIVIASQKIIDSYTVDGAIRGQIVYRVAPGRSGFAQDNSGRMVSQSLGRVQNTRISGVAIWDGHLTITRNPEASIEWPLSLCGESDCIRSIGEA